jgi:hypothetical protein
MLSIGYAAVCTTADPVLYRCTRPSRSGMCTLPLVWGACVYRYGPVTKSKLSYAVLGTLGIYFTVCTRTRVAYTDAQVAG